MSVATPLSRGVEAARELVLHKAHELVLSLQEDDASRAYREAFEEEAHDPRGEPRGREELVEALAAARVVLAGAFHTNPETGVALARVLGGVVAKGRAPWGLLLPCLRAGEHDEALGAFAAGALDAEGLCEAIEDSGTWPFGIETYQPLIEGAAERRLELLACPALPAGPRTPGERAEADAGRIRTYLEGDPTRRVLAVVGEHHLARSHLPRRLAEAGGPGPDETERVVQTAWPAYYELLEAGERPAAARLPAGMWALFGTSPTRLFESYSNWLHHVPEIPWPVLPAWREADDPVLETILERVAGGIVEALELDLDPSLRPWGRLVTHETPERLAELDLDEAGRDELLSQVERGRGYFLPGEPALFLPGAGGGTLAEEVTHALHFHLHPARSFPDPAEDFLARALREAVGFMGSRVITPDRPYWDPDHLLPDEQLLEGLATRLLLGDPWEQARAFLEEWRTDGVVELDPPAGALRELHAQGMETYLAAAHAAGYLLGARVPLEPDLARALFVRPPGEDEASLRESWEFAWGLAALEDEDEDGPGETMSGEA